MRLSCDVALVKSSCSRCVRPAVSRRAVAIRAQAKPVGQDPTPQQLRGHGANGWKDAGYDCKDPDKLEPKLRELLVHYGQLAQATYDNLGQDPDQKTWGYTTVAPAHMIDYLTPDYPLRPGVQIILPPGSSDMYFLPQDLDVHHDQDVDKRLSPLIYAQAALGKVVPPVDPNEAEKLKLLSDLYDAEGDVSNIDTATEAFNTESVQDGLKVVAKLPVKLLGRGRILFKDGVSRSAFMGYVAVSKRPGSESDTQAQTSDPKNHSIERDVVFVWRGTIFEEEWGANFGQDLLVPFNPAFDPNKDCPPANLAEVALHDGFHDLYMRATAQPDPSNPSAVPALPKKSGKAVAPRTVVGKWLKKLQQEYNITTVTTTGHSLGGALSTLSAYDIGLQLKDMWADTAEAKAARKGWKTKAKPTVTAITFAAPRVGNLAFRMAFRDKLNIKHLRICNAGDIVPLFPGTFNQLKDSIRHMFNSHVYDDTDSEASKARDKVRAGLQAVAGKLGWKALWDYHHVGTILKVNSNQNFVDRDGQTPLGATPRGLRNMGKHHNLEVYLHFLDKKGVDAKGQPLTTNRNPLLLNKSDKILKEAAWLDNWWRDAKTKGYELQHGRWQNTKKPIT